MPTSASSADVPDRRTVLALVVQGERYCVETERIAAVLGVERDQRLDETADPWYAGTVSVDGGRVRVIDLVRVLAGPTVSPSRGSEPKLLVFEGVDEDGLACGWLVDDVERTVSIDADDIEAVGSSLRFFSASVRLSDGDDPSLWLDDRAINGGSA